MCQTFCDFLGLASLAEEVNHTDFSSLSSAWYSDLKPDLWWFYNIHKAHHKRVKSKLL